MHQTTQNSLSISSEISNKHNLFGRLHHSRIALSSSRIGMQQFPLNPHAKHIFFSIARILNRMRIQSFNRIKKTAVKNKIITLVLPLMQRKMQSDLLHLGFLALKGLTVQKVGQKIQQKINIRRNPNILVRVLQGLHRQALNNGFRTLKKNYSRFQILKNYMDSSKRIFNKLVQRRIHQAFNAILSKCQQLQAIRNLLVQIQRMQAKSVKRLKLGSFISIVQVSYVRVFHNEKGEKEDRLKTLADKRTSQHKSIINMRQGVRALQASINSQTFQKNTVKKDFNREVRATGAKIEQECKQIQRQIKKVKNEQELLNHQLQHRQTYLKRRLKSKATSQNLFEKVREIYEILNSHQEEEFKNAGKVKPLLPIRRSTNDIDDFLIYENLKLKEQVRMYEDINIEIDTPELERGKTENQRIRHLIQLLVYRQLNTTPHQQQSALF